MHQVQEALERLAACAIQHKPPIALHPSCQGIHDLVGRALACERASFFVALLERDHVVYVGIFAYVFLMSINSVGMEV